MKDLLVNALKAGRGALKGVLEEFGITKENQEKLLAKLDQEINIELENNLTNNNSLVFSDGISYEKYLSLQKEKERLEEILKSYEEKARFTEEDIKNLYKEYYESNFLTERLDFESFLILLTTEDAFDELHIESFLNLYNIKSIKVDNLFEEIYVVYSFNLKELDIIKNLKKNIKNNN